MKNYDIKPACNFCASPYYDKNFSNVNAMSFDALKPDKKGYPVLMDFTLENTCNLSCIMCDSSLSSSLQKKQTHDDCNNSFSFDEDFLYQLEAFYPHLKTVVFTGGEPFLIKTYFKIWARLIEVNPHITINITTNGTVYNEEIAKLLESAKFNITVSVDSFVPALYEKIRLGANFEKTMENAQKFSDYCKKAGTLFTIIVCPMQSNAMEIPDMVRKCNQNSWNVSFNQVIKPWQLALWSLPSEKIESLLRFYKAQKFVANNDIIYRDNITKFEALSALTENYLKKAIKREKNPLPADEIINLKQNIITVLKTKINESVNYEKIEKKSEKIEEIIHGLPDILIKTALIDYLNNINTDLLLNELENTDVSTTIERLSIIAFNID